MGQSLAPDEQDISQDWNVSMGSRPILLSQKVRTSLHRGTLHQSTDQDTVGRVIGVTFTKPVDEIRLASRNREMSGKLG